MQEKASIETTKNSIYSLTEKPYFEKLAENSQNEKKISKDTYNASSSRSDAKITEKEHIDSIGARSNKSTRAYDIKKIREYMEMKKHKRIVDAKNQKEKRKIEKCLKNSNLEALQRKQRNIKTLSARNNFLVTANLGQEIDQNQNSYTENDEINLKIRDLLDKSCSNIKICDDSNLINSQNLEVHLYDSYNNSLQPEGFDFKGPLNKQLSVDKHDRLMNICKVALELQSKLEEAKIKMFNLSNINTQTSYEEIENDFNYYSMSGSNNIEITQAKPFAENNSKAFENRKKIGALNTEFPTFLSFTDYESFDIKKKEHTVEIDKSVQNTSNIININDALDKERPEINNKPSSLTKEPNIFQKWTILSDDCSFINLTKEKINKLNKKSNLHESFNANLDYKKSQEPFDQQTQVTHMQTDKITYTEKFEILPNEISFNDGTISNNETAVRADFSLTTPFNVVQMYNDYEKKNSKNGKEKTHNDYDDMSYLKRVDNNLKTVDEVTDTSTLSLQNSSINTMKIKTSKRKFEAKEDRRNQYSPSSLDRMLKAGLNYLDNLNNSVIQIEEFDKIRCIGMAQNESVILAQLLRTQKLEQDMNNLREKSSREVISTMQSNKKILSDIQDKLNALEKNDDSAKENKSMKKDSKTISNELNSLGEVSYKDNTFSRSYVSKSMARPDLNLHSCLGKNNSLNEINHSKTLENSTSSDMESETIKTDIFEDSFSEYNIAKKNDENNFNQRVKTEKKNLKGIETICKEILPSQSHIQSIKETIETISTDSDAKTEHESFGNTKIESKKPSKHRYFYPLSIFLFSLSSKQYS